MASSVRLVTGSFDYSLGIDSGRVTTVVSEQNPNGLKYSQLAWLTNGTVRGGGISPRLGYQQLVGKIPGAAGLFQGEYLYEPTGANPYKILSIGGVIWKVLVDAPYTITNLSAQFGLFNPPAPTKVFMEQGESFLVIQAGDLTTNPPTLPLFWDGATLRRSNGINPPLPGFVSQTFNVVVAAPFTFPSVGFTGPLSLGVNYPGQVGDVVNFGQPGNPSALGSFLVTFIGVNSVTLQTITSPFVGATLAPGPAVFTTTALRTVHVANLAAPWTNPAIGGSVVVTLTAPYAGNVNDTGTWADNAFGGKAGGTFQVTNIAGNTITLLVVTTGFTGQVWLVADNPYSLIVSSAAAPTVPPTNELPAAGPMKYYQGRLWYAVARKVIAGDIVGNASSGTLPFNFTDSILKVTENPLAIGGDGFRVPDNSGNVTALNFTANDNSVLGEGELYVFTRKQIYGLNVPVTRTDWINANSNNQPLMVVAQRKYGAAGDRAVVAVNGDLFYQTIEPGIRSLKTSVRNDNVWLNIPLSRNENRVLAFNDRSLMDFATGIEFDNRILQAVLPFATPVGVAFRGIIPLDLDIIGSFGQQDVPPAWEGMTQGLNVLQLTEGDFGGRSRAFATAYGDSGNIEIWELTDFSTVDVLPASGPTGNRVGWYFETPAYDFGKLFELKRLDGAEIYIDLVSGTVDVLVEYRTDADNCWQYWDRTQFCSAKNDCEAGTNPDPTCAYPTPTLCLGQRFPLGLPKPQQPANCVTMNQRPVTDGFQFQVRVTLKGFCRVRGILIFALPLERQPFYNMSCPK